MYLPAMYLLQEMEEFAQSSGNDGIVVFTLGSMIPNITTEKADMVASALAQIPQKVRKVFMRLSCKSLKNICLNILKITE